MRNNQKGQVEAAAVTLKPTKTLHRVVLYTHWARSYNSQQRTSAMVPPERLPLRCATVTLQSWGISSLASTCSVQSDSKGARMKKTIAIALMLASMCMAQSRKQQAWYYSSVGAVYTTQFTDIHSSWGGIEANPLLGRGHKFGWESAVIKLSAVTAGMLFQHWAVKKYPPAMKYATITNFVIAGAGAAITIRNYNISTPLNPTQKLSIPVYSGHTSPARFLDPVKH